jgi:uncharacterized protein YkwD
VQAKASMTDQERQVVSAINMLRASGGLPPLKRSAKLAGAAALQDSTMLRLGFFSHEWPDGTDPVQRVRRFFGDGMIGETLAYAPASGDTSAVGVVKMWLNSPAHLKILISRDYRRVGVSRQTGTLFGKPVVIWTADFGAHY